MSQERDEVVDSFWFLLKNLKGKVLHVSRKFAEPNDTNAGDLKWDEVWLGD